MKMVFSWQLEKVKEIFENNIDLIEARDAGRNTPLIVAVRWNYRKLAQLLIDYGAYVNERNSYNCTPLHFASGVGITKILI